MKVISESAFQCQVNSGRTCVINSGQVYDVTDFVSKHPGGKEILENHSGEDVTQLMKTHDTHQHSPAAYRILDKYYIGHLNNSGGELRKRGQSSGTDGKDLTSDKVSGLVNGEANGYIVHNVLKDNIADWSKPVFWQVGSFGDKYFDWVHDPIDHHMRLFYSDVLEFFSWAPWWLVVLYWTPICAVVLWLSYTEFLAGPVLWNLIGLGSVTVPLTCFPVLFLLGVLMWTLDEYIVHRWLFHMRPPTNSKFLITAHFLLHGQHHKSPMDKKRLVFPPLPATVLGVIIYYTYRLIAPPAVTHVLFAGTIVGYLGYDLIHYYLHHGTPFLTYFQDLKTYHVKHHFKDQQRGFGISSKLWDYPFGTLIK